MQVSDVGYVQRLVDVAGGVVELGDFGLAAGCFDEFVAYVACPSLHGAGLVGLRDARDVGCLEERDEERPGGAVLVVGQSLLGEGCEVEGGVRRVRPHSAVDRVAIEVLEAVAVVQIFRRDAVDGWSVCHGDGPSALT